MLFDYFKVNESEQYHFLQLPSMLIKDSTFKSLSSDSKILYSLLLNRTALSAKNNWVDDSGNVYIIYTLDQMCEDLNCWEQKAVKAMKELKDIGLVKSVRRGLGKANIIYVMNFATSLKYKNPEKSEQPETPGQLEMPGKPVNTLNCENHSSGTLKITVQELPESQFRNFENHSEGILTLRNTDSIEIESRSMSKSTSDQAVELSTSNPDKTMTLTVDNENLIEGSGSSKGKGPSQPATPSLANGLQSPSPNNLSSTDDYTTYKRLIQDNINYSHYLHNRRTEIDLVDELINCMLDVICTQGDTVKINGEQKSRSMVKGQYLKITSLDIEHILDRYKEQHHKITHLHSYLKTMLYTIKQEAGHYYTNAVRADGLVW